jgi:hypothetical protein
MQAFSPDFSLLTYPMIFSALKSPEPVAVSQKKKYEEQASDIGQGDGSESAKKKKVLLSHIFHGCFLLWSSHFVAPLQKKEKVREVEEEEVHDISQISQDGEKKVFLTDSFFRFTDLAVLKKLANFQKKKKKKKAMLDDTEME